MGWLNNSVMSDKEFIRLCAEEKIKEVKKALAAGVDVNEHCTVTDLDDANHRTALESAAKVGHAETVETLVKASADVSARDKNGHNAPPYLTLNTNPSAEEKKALADKLMR